MSFIPLPHFSFNTMVVAQGVCTVLIGLLPLIDHGDGGGEVTVWFAQELGGGRMLKGAEMLSLCTLIPLCPSLHLSKGSVL